MHRTPWELNASNNRPFFILYSVFYVLLLFLLGKELCSYPYYSKYFCKKQGGKKFVHFKTDFFLPLKVAKYTFYLNRKCTEIYLFRVKKQYIFLTHNSFIFVSPFRNASISFLISTSMIPLFRLYSVVLTII